MLPWLKRRQYPTSTAMLQYQNEMLIVNISPRAHTQEKRTVAALVEPPPPDTTRAVDDQKNDEGNGKQRQHYQQKNSHASLPRHVEFATLGSPPHHDASQCEQAEGDAERIDPQPFPLLAEERLPRVQIHHELVQ